MIQVWTINILVIRSHGRTEKRKNGQKHHRTKAAKDKNQSGQNPQKRKYFNTITIKVYDPISVHVITWYRCGQSTFSSCDHVGRQRKAKMDKSTIGQKPQRIKIKADKTTKRENILTLTLPGPSAGVSGSLDSYYSLKPLCSGMGEIVPARTSPTLLPPSPRTVLLLSCFKVLQCIICRD